MRCQAVYIVNEEVHVCRRRRRHRWRHYARFAIDFRDYNGRVLATSTVRLRWSEWRPSAAPDPC